MFFEQTKTLLLVGRIFCPDCMNSDPFQETIQSTNVKGPATHGFQGQLAKTFANQVTLFLFYAIVEWVLLVSSR